VSLRVLIADDELLARQRLARLLGAVADVEVVGECERGDDVVARVRAGGVDVLVLDIQMPGLSGTEVVGLLGPSAPYVVFSTAHAEHAVEAFELGAVDYILKPVSAARLERALERARRWVGSAAAPPRPLALETKDGVALVDPGEISHAVFDGALVTVYAGGRAYLSTETLSHFELRLPPGHFFRVSRRALLCLARVKLLEPTPSGGYVATMDDGAEVEISRQAARELRRSLGLARG
jgi:two-component system LytT family response regulator